LLYVGILAINGDHAAEDPTGYELLRFAITFIMSWKIWSDVALIISWFKTDDIIQRVSVLFIMACLLGSVYFLFPAVALDVLYNGYFYMWTFPGLRYRPY
jgi:hypothetical protein